MSNVTIPYSDDLLNEAEELLEHYGYRYTDEGVKVILDTWAKNKAPLYNLLRKHPLWDEDKLMIHFDSDIKRTVDKQQINQFHSWFLSHVPEYKINGMNYNYYNSLYSLIDDTFEEMRMIDSHGFHVTKNNLPTEAWALMASSISDIIDSFDNHSKYNSNGYRIDNMYRLLLTYSDTLTEETVKYFNTVAKKLGMRKSFHVGQKTTRAIANIAKALGIDQIHDMKDVYHNGEYQSKDVGWNYQFALFADAISSLSVKRHTIISINPIDYWKMSIGRGWRSCHTIDKNNIDRCSDTSHVYSGAYSAGTESYMLDSTSMIFYTLPTEYDGNDFETQEKEKRCIFWYNKGTLGESRVYPDGRSSDGEDLTYGDQFRNIMQKVISDCEGKPNLWKVRKGTFEDYTNTYGNHYPDYEKYKDCSISWLKDENGNINDKITLEIGHEAICPNCGEEHDRKDSIICEGCENDYFAQCHECGYIINEDDGYIYDEDTGNYYCDTDCANRHDVHYCADTEDYHSDCYYDDYDENYYYDTEDKIEAEDGEYTFFNEHNAREYGCYIDDYDLKWYFDDGDKVETEDGYIYHSVVNAIEDDCYRDCYSGLWYRNNNNRIDTNDGHSYSSAENAEADGYVKNEDGNWVKEVEA